MKSPLFIEKSRQIRKFVAFEFLVSKVLRINFWYSKWRIDQIYKCLS